ncbi:glycosyltransferase family 4 protein [Plantactinospora sp. GCM10030261]|uniref:glycosyltransferase family 4 protein n=1 Tax=Plantactinospora sp. GCM10030261 TaxID=3273420 RepID=UPI003605BA93
MEQWTCPDERPYVMILFLVQCPTPQHTPTFNRLADEFGLDLTVFYLEPAPQDDRGWGDVVISHRYEVLSDVRARVALARALLSSDLAAVCLYGYRDLPRIGASLIARLRATPVFLRVTGNVRDELARSRLRRLAKRWYLRAILGQPEIWVIGTSNAAWWATLGQRRHHLIPYSLARLPDGADGAPALRRQLDLAGRFVFAFVGRLEPIKGLADLLNAYDQVRASLPPHSTALMITGSGSLEPLVRDYASSHDDCHYLGALPQSRLGAVYVAADCVVIPSLSETWCWVVNEALGFGTRVVASDAVAAADDHGREETGRRCPVSDAAGLAEAMRSEYELGPRAAPRLPPRDTAADIADRLRSVVGVEAPGRPKILLD